jgi:hypothetical protein
MPTSTSNGRWRWPSGTLPTAASVEGATLLPKPHLGAGRLGADVDDAAQANVQGVREELSSRTSDCETAAGSTTRWLTSSNPLRNFG